MTTWKMFFRSAVAIAFFCTSLNISGNTGSLMTRGSLFTQAAAAKVVIKTKRHHHHHHPVRRVVRSAIYISTLPSHCVKVIINNASYWSCHGKYYQHHHGRYVLVYVH